MYNDERIAALLTWALGTFVSKLLNVYDEGVNVIGKFPLSESIFAPLSVNKSMTLAIGLFINWLLPTILEEKFCLESKPINNLAVVPELLASRSCFGSSKPFKPTPCILIIFSSIKSILTPNDRKISIVAAVSPEIKIFSKEDSPSAREPKIIHLWDIDLSPKIVTSPEIVFNELNLVAFLQISLTKLFSIQQMNLNNLLTLFSLEDPLFQIFP